MKLRTGLGSLLLTLALMSTACDSSPAAQPTVVTAPTSAATAPATTGAPTGATGTKDEIILAIGGESKEGYDPTLGWGRYGAPLFQSTLLRRDENLKLVNDLATGYTLSPDRLTWTVTIRPDAKFSDGVAVTAKDVAFTFNDAAKSGGLTDVTVLDKATATSDTTAELHLKEPQSTFVNRLATLGIVPEHAHNAQYARNPIGSGPYKLVKWDEGQQLIVERNPLYYGPAPQIARLVFLFAEEDTAFAAAKAGKVQVVSVPQSLGVQKLDGMKLIVVPSVDNRGLLFPFPAASAGLKTAKGEPIGNNVTADPAIRRAVNYALDRKALVAGVLEGFGSPAYGPVTGLAWDQPKAVFQDAQPDQAKQMLADGGWKDSDGDGIVDKNGLKAELPIIYPASDSTRQALALAAADQIRKIGIAVTVDGKSWDDIPKLMHSNIIVFGWGSHDQTEMYDLYYSKKATGDYYNAGYYSNPKVDNYLDLAMGAPSEAEAIAYWQAAQWDEKGTGFTAPGDAVWAWMVNLNHTYFVNTCLDTGKQQVEPHGHGWPITANITQWKWTCPNK